MLEACRALGDRLSHVVYASSSNVYGGATKVPFSETDPLPEPSSFYAATKRSGELIASAYAGLYGLRQVGLRFFTVYGPWGRPDMAYWLWTESILKGEPIQVFNRGDMRRDFTFIDDVSQAVANIVERAPDFGEGRPHRLYNVGNNRPAALGEVIGVLEAALGRTAVRQLEPMQPGDVKETFADIEAIRRDYGFRPSVSIEDGLPRFVDWYRSYFSV
jgi:UDP-glucuronate 4-epimerase